LKISINIPPINTHKDFYSQNKASNLQFSNKKDEQGNSKNNNSAVIAVTAIGTIIPLMIIRKYQGKSLNKELLKGMDFKSKSKEYLKSLNIEYELNEMLLMGFGSIFGGLLGGLAATKNENKDKKAKIKEAVFQFSNIAIPTSIVAGLLELSKKHNYTGILPKVASAIIGIGAGMPIAAEFSNKINNEYLDKDNPMKRKLRIKDCFVHVDDLIGVLVLSKIPLADKLHIEKVLPVLYGICGFEAGTKKQ